MPKPFDFADFFKYPHFMSENLNDELYLLDSAKNGDEKAFESLKNIYDYLIKSIAINFVTAYLDYDDLYQEASLGFLNSVQTFDKNKSASFKTYATSCIKNKAICAYRASLRDKNKPINDSLQLDKISEFLTEKDPQDIISSKEKLKNIKQKINLKLSKVEKQVLILFLKGEKYKDIANILNLSEKSVNNALQRARNKLKN